MPINISVSNVKAADPGFGFTLNLNNNGSPINQTIAVKIVINNQYNSWVSINNPVSDTTINFVIPFGDVQYPSQIGTFLPFIIEVWAPNSPSQPPTYTLTGTVVAESGQFVF